MKGNEYDDLLKHLRGFRKVVINTCHGGFGLSGLARDRFLEQSKTQYTLVEREDRYSQDAYGPYIKLNDGSNWTEGYIERDDPILVKIIEELGTVANGPHSKLKVVEIPADVKWEIDEYDGREWIAEVHRTWS
jgi:hypothetical protein